MKKDLAPIVLFAYKRLEHLKATLQALQANPLAAHSPLIVFSDGAKNPQEAPQIGLIRDYIVKIKGFQSVQYHFREQNMGLANSIIQGLTQVFEQYEKVIVLEDDMICTTDFLKFMNEALRFYQPYPDIFSLSGYSFPLSIPKNYPHSVYILPRASSWGWGTWKNRWEKANWDPQAGTSLRNDSTLKQAFNQGGEDLSSMLIRQERGEVDSWAIRWIYCHFQEKAWALYPLHSKIQNIGVDGSGTHSPSTQKYQSTLSEQDYDFVYPLKAEPLILQSLKKFFRFSIFRRFLNRWKYGV